MSKYFKNFILCGDIDYHCILCEETFHSEAEVEKHIRWEKHRKILKQQSYYSKLKKEFIYKLQNNTFYCEVCNIIISDMKGANEHVKAKIHQNNKSKPETAEAPNEMNITREDHGLTRICNVLVSKHRWHCISEDKCLLCKTDIYNIDRHINSASHMLKLVSSKTKSKDRNGFYREVDPDDFYCFTCYNTYSKHVFDEHFEGRYHKDMFVSLKQDFPVAQTSQAQRKDLLNENKIIEIAKRLIESQMEHFTVDIEKKCAVCIKCNVSVDINYKDMIDHRKIHIEEERQEPRSSETVDATECSDESDVRQPMVGRCFYFDHGKRRAELAQFGRPNFIKLTCGGRRGYCTLCNNYLPPHIKNFKEHIAGSSHVGQLQLKGLKVYVRHNKPNYKTRALKDYLRKMYYASYASLYIINMEIIIDEMSFLMVRLIDLGNATKRVCFTCDVVYQPNREREHILSTSHRDNFFKAKVLIGYREEFVREIRPDLYHCGFCNLTYPFWENLDKHLNTWQHKLWKSKNEQISQTFYEQIENCAVDTRGLSNEMIYQRMIYYYMS